ncbi:hypothetical protein [Prauserella rugosa]|uniref:hypothetical protein n=1 Tax=Prauserella rugosa TaxID=43354 RepID=UPI00068E443C|nr:hypothetical protein [Prauserella rugosa]
MTEHARTDTAIEPAATGSAAEGPRSAQRSADGPRRARGRLHQPWRVVVALVELVLAAVAVVVAFPVWNSSIREVTVQASDGADLTSRVYEGSGIALAVALGAVALVLVIDAIRQLMLGIAAKGRKPKKRANPDPDPDVDTDGDHDTNHGTDHGTAARRNAGGHSGQEAGTAG